MALMNPALGNVKNFNYNALELNIMKDAMTHTRFIMK